MRSSGTRGPEARGRGDEPDRRRAREHHGDVDPLTAFEVFTTEIDLWWKRGPRFRAPADERLAFEPGVGGRLLAYRESGEVWEIGRVLVWEAGKRLVFEWRARSFEADQLTEVEILFEAEGSATRVSLEHRGWDALPVDHPVRQGLADEPAFRAFFGLWWADLLFALRAHLRLRGRMRAR